MAQERKEGGFKISDRRLFTPDGELRESTEEQTSAPSAGAGAAGAAPTATTAPAASHVHETAPRQTAPLSEADIPPPPTASEQQAQHDAYKQSARNLDKQVELGGHAAKDLEVNFERFLASLYMTAMLQLGLMHEQGGQPTVDLIGARQTIDTIGMLSEKTKGNLTPKEQGFLQNCLYELRMAYVEVTNALARPPQAPGQSTGTNG